MYYLLYKTNMFIRMKKYDTPLSLSKRPAYNNI